MKLSTGLRNHLTSVGSLKGGLDGAGITLYSGVAPNNADDEVPPSAVALAVISAGAEGVTFEAGPDAGLLLKAPSEVWSGPVDETGVATWFRLSHPSDSGGGSTSAIRIQGSVAVAGGDMQITNTSLVTGAIQSIDYFSLVMPSA